MSTDCPTRRAIAAGCASDWMNSRRRSRRAYLVVEKILGAGEVAAADWGVDGTSGYDFMNEVSALQHDASSADGAGALVARADAVGRPTSRTKKSPARQEILQRGFDAQLGAVTRRCTRLARSTPERGTPRRRRSGAV